MCVCVRITDFNDDEPQPLSFLSLRVCDTLQFLQQELLNSKQIMSECFQNEEKANESEGFLKIFPLIINNFKNEKCTGVGNDFLGNFLSGTRGQIRNHNFGSWKIKY